MEVISLKDMALRRQKDMEAKTNDADELKINQITEDGPVIAQYASSVSSDEISEQKQSQNSKEVNINGKVKCGRAQDNEDYLIPIELLRSMQVLLRSISENDQIWPLSTSEKSHLEMKGFPSQMLVEIEKAELRENITQLDDLVLIICSQYTSKEPVKNFDLVCGVLYQHIFNDDFLPQMRNVTRMLLQMRSELPGNVSLPDIYKRSKQVRHLVLLLSLHVEISEQLFIETPSLLLNCWETWLSAETSLSEKNSLLLLESLNCLVGTEFFRSVSLKDMSRIIFGFTTKVLMMLTKDSAKVQILLKQLYDLVKSCREVETFVDLEDVHKKLAKFKIHTECEFERSRLVLLLVSASKISERLDGMEAVKQKQFLNIASKVKTKRILGFKLLNEFLLLSKKTFAFADAEEFCELFFRGRKSQSQLAMEEKNAMADLAISLHSKLLIGSSSEKSTSLLLTKLVVEPLSDESKFNFSSSQRTLSLIIFSRLGRNVNVTRSLVKTVSSYFSNANPSAEMAAAFESLECVLLHNSDQSSNRNLMLQVLDSAFSYDPILRRPAAEALNSLLKNDSLSIFHDVLHEHLQKFPQLQLFPHNHLILDAEVVKASIKSVESMLKGIRNSKLDFFGESIHFLGLAYPDDEIKDDAKSFLAAHFGSTASNSAFDSLSCRDVCERMLLELNARSLEAIINFSEKMKAEISFDNGKKVDPVDIWKLQAAFVAQIAPESILKEEFVKTLTRNIIFSSNQGISKVGFQITRRSLRAISQLKNCFDAVISQLPDLSSRFANETIAFDPKIVHLLSKLNASSCTNYICYLEALLSIWFQKCSFNEAKTELNLESIEKMVKDHNWSGKTWNAFSSLLNQFWNKKYNASNGKENEIGLKSLLLWIQCFEKSESNDTLQGLEILLQKQKISHGVSHCDAIFNQLWKTLGCISTTTQDGNQNENQNLKKQILEAFLLQQPFYFNNFVSILLNESMELNNLKEDLCCTAIEVCMHLISAIGSENDFFVYFCVLFWVTHICSKIRSTAQKCIESNTEISAETVLSLEEALLSTKCAKTFWKSAFENDKFTEESKSHFILEFERFSKANVPVSTLILIAMCMKEMPEIQDLMPLLIRIIKEKMNALGTFSLENALLLSCF